MSESDTSFLPAFYGLFFHKKEKRLVSLGEFGGFNTFYLAFLAYAAKIQSGCITFGRKFVDTLCESLDIDV